MRGGGPQGVAGSVSSFLPKALERSQELENKQKRLADSAAKPCTDQSILFLLWQSGCSQVEVFHVDFSMIADSEERETADFVVAVGPDGGFGIADQAAGIDQTDFSSL